MTQKFMSRHDVEHEEGNFVVTKLFMSRHTIQVLTLEGMKEMSQHKTLMSR